jgi:hypothetical protein
MVSSICASAIKLGFDCREAPWHVTIIAHVTAMCKVMGLANVD